MTYRIFGYAIDIIFQIPDLVYLNFYNMLEYKVASVV